MNVTLYYPEIEFYYTVNVWKKEIIEYLWEKEFNRKFDESTYLLDDKNSRVYNTLENKWLHYELDEYSIMKEPEFTQFLLDRFEDEAKTKYWEEEEQKEDPYDWWGSLDDDEKEVVMRSYRGY